MMERKARPKKREQVLSVRLTEREYATVARAAERASLPAGTWARVKILAAVGAQP